MTGPNLIVWTESDRYNPFNGMFAPNIRAAQWISLVKSSSNRHSI